MTQGQRHQLIFHIVQAGLQVTDFNSLPEGGIPQAPKQGVSNLNMQIAWGHVVRHTPSL